MSSNNIISIPNPAANATGPTRWSPFLNDPLTNTLSTVVSGSGVRSMGAAAGSRTVTTTAVPSGLPSLRSVGASVPLPGQTDSPHAHLTSNVHSLMSHLGNSGPAASNTFDPNDSKAVAQVLMGIDNAAQLSGAIDAPADVDNMPVPPSIAALIKGSDNGNLDEKKKTAKDQETAAKAYALRNRRVQLPEGAAEEENAAAEDEDFKANGKAGSDDEDGGSSDVSSDGEDARKGRGKSRRQAGTRQQHNLQQGPQKPHSTLGRPITYNGDLNADDVTEEERRRLKRRIANRESARRVRQKRQELMEELQQKVTALTHQNARLLTHIATAEHNKQALQSQVVMLRERYTSKTSENNTLVAESMALRKALQERGVNPNDILQDLIPQTQANGNGNGSGRASTGDVNLPASSSAPHLFSSAFAPVQGGIQLQMNPQSSASAAAAAAAAACGMLPTSGALSSHLTGFHMM